MKKPKVYVSRIIADEGLDLLREVCDLHIWQQRELMPRDVQLKLFADCTGLLTTTDIKVNTQLLEACPAVKVVSNQAVGYDNIDIAACTAAGVPVGNTPDVLTETTADLAFTLILASARRLAEMVEWVKQDHWTPETGMLENLATDVHHATLGIIGLGRIGREVARRATGFNMTILYHDLKRDPQAEQEFGVRYVDKEALLRRSDFVSLHLPLTAETHHYIGPNELKLMKPSSMLINSARGQIVDQTALLSALKNGQIAGAGLDVTDPEPMRSNNPLLALPQVIILPHIGSATRKTRAKMAQRAAQNLINALNGRPMLSCVNPESIGQGRSASLYK
ncbi:MAG: D-glycerate dehydrogenase [Deltaproteobacteria bacterium]|jgi:glyoxylate reductase|nr:D-glycerate dehydrogenase [Deltaproteobacteria bacterium]